MNPATNLAPPALPSDARILILGANGQLGHALHQACQQLGPDSRVLALDRRGLDLSQPDFGVRLHAQLAQFRPHWILNAAAYTAVDRAESEPELAHRVNAWAVGQLAQAAHDAHARLIHFSTDYVFDGSGERPWVENDTPHPVNVYGHSKWTGEQALRAIPVPHLVLRTSWVYGHPGHNFVNTVLRLAKGPGPLRMVNDQFGAPTSTRLLCAVTLHAMAMLGEADAHDPRWGTYHVCPLGETHWQHFAQAIIRGAQGCGLVGLVDPEQVQGIPSSAYPTPAKRPHNSRLNTHRLQTELSFSLPQWEDELNDHLISALT